MAFRMIRGPAKEPDSSRKIVRQRERLSDESASLYKRYADDPELAKISRDRALSADERRIEIGRAILRSATRDVAKEYDFDASDEEDVLGEGHDLQERRKRKLEEFLADDEEASSQWTAGMADATKSEDDSLNQQSQLTSSPNKRARKSLLQGVVHTALTEKMLAKEGRWRDRVASTLKENLGADRLDAAVEASALSVGVGESEEMVNKQDTKEPQRPILSASLSGGHRLSVTCLVVCKSGEWCVTGSKDGSIIKWNLKSGQRERRVWHAYPAKRGTTVTKEELRRIRPKPVLCLAMCPEEKFIVSGGADGLIRVWLADTLDFKDTFHGHRDAVTGMAISRGLKRGPDDEYVDDTVDGSDQGGTQQTTLFSTGADRQVRVYDLYQMGFAEPLFGHTLRINGVSSTSDERCITVSDDRTVRYWRLKTQSQLIFKDGHSGGMIDVCTMVNPSIFVTGSTDGSLALWSAKRKRAVYVHPKAHCSENGNRVHWITALASRPNSDVFASGAGDGVIRIWSLSRVSFSLIRAVRVQRGGFINDIQWSKKGDRLICAVGNEPRLGRWENIKGGHNGLFIIKLPMQTDEEDEGSEEEDDEQSDEVKEDQNDDSADDALVSPKQKKQRMEFNVAESWDRWDARDKGDFSIHQSMMEDAKSQDKDPKHSSNKKRAKKPSNEWNDFFGRLYGQK